MHRNRCIVSDVNGIELYVLGRRLMKIGEAAMPAAGFRRLPTSVQLVLVDIGDHPDTSISGVVARTGLPQSAVSEAVARLARFGALSTSTDPADRRRTLVRVAADVRGRRKRAPADPVDGPLAEALGASDAAEVADVVAMLTDLARRFDAQADRSRSKDRAATPPDGKGK
jgi:DNA-binding MarR family transcriptional regulator